MAYRERVSKWTDVGLPASLADLVYIPVVSSGAKTTFSGHDPACKGKVVYAEGCTQCHTCSWSVC